jgi:AraC-like DNA-binding protein
MPGYRCRPAPARANAHICSLGALDRRRAEQHRLIGVLVDQLATAEDVSLDLPLPRDDRACRLAALIDADTSGSLGRLARRAGASLRTLERLYLAETGVPVGEWRRRAVSSMPSASSRPAARSATPQTPPATRPSAPSPPPSSASSARPPRRRRGGR